MSNITSRTYCPRSGSLPAAVIAYFQKNLSAKLSSAEVAAKFNVPSASIHTNLNLAVEAGFIARDNGYYTAGDDIDQAPEYGAVDQANATIEKARETPRNAFGTPITQQASPLPPKAPTPAKQALPDPASLLIEDDVPLTPGRGAPVDWGALLARMQPGQSAALPRSAKATLSKAVTEWHKTKPEVFTIKKVNDEQIRIWRTA